jgi:hypothetical protein
LESGLFQSNWKQKLLDADNLYVGIPRRSSHTET